MQMKYPANFLISMLAAVMLPAFAQTIPVHELAMPAVLDGADNDWSGIPAVSIPLHKSIPDGTVELKEVKLKAGVYGDEIFFYAKWEDSTHDTIHKPWVWSEERQKYVKGPQREDRFSMQFEMEGAYTTDWISGQSFKADMWHWKSARTNSLGAADDKMTVISRNKLLRAAKIKGRDGFVYILRSVDAGERAYKTKRYAKKDKRLMPKYVPNPKASGSAMDIKAKGRWQHGWWHLELKRKLNTAYADDAVFVRGQAVKGGIGIFNRSKRNDHAISETLLFQLPDGLHAQ
ncbi:MAG: hypothetical protein GY862_03480 [Gammaproteobacteria bacterium]|nr:hypothetical protein [Gammaproteobacteria bacterium]